MRGWGLRPPPLVMNRRANRKERRAARNHWIATEGRRIQTYSRLMGGTIPDFYWKAWFSPEFSTLVYKRAEAFELVVELNVITGHSHGSQNPCHWPSANHLRAQLEDLRAEKHTRP